MIYGAALPLLCRAICRDHSRAATAHADGMREAPPFAIPLPAMRAIMRASLPQHRDARLHCVMLRAYAQ